MRKCSFEPKQHLIQCYEETTNQPIVDPVTGEAKFTLPTNERMVWFHTYCDENGVDGYIDDSEVRFEKLDGREIGHLCIATATVYIDGKIAGKASSSVPFYGTGTYDKYIVATATTYAKGRALANAGFCTLEASEEGNKIPPEMPVTSSQLAAHGIEVPLKHETIAKAAPASESVYSISHAETKSDNGYEMNLEIAEEVIWPTNTFRGQKLKDLANTENGRRGIFKVANGELSARYKEMYPEFICACNTLVKAYNIRVS